MFQDSRSAWLIKTDKEECQSNEMSYPIWRTVSQANRLRRLSQTPVDFKSIKRTTVWKSTSWGSQPRGCGMQRRHRNATSNGGLSSYTLVKRDDVNGAKTESSGETMAFDWCYRLLSFIFTGTGCQESTKRSHPVYSPAAFRFFSFNFWAALDLPFQQPCFHKS